MNIEYAIFLIRGRRVMLDEDLAKLYGVETRTLNQAVNRNKKRFPEDFMFKLTGKEFQNLTSQFVISSWGGRRRKPFVFTEHGTVMLASVLRSDRAIKMNIEVVKAFVRLNKALSTQADVAKEISEVRSFILKLSNKTDREFKKVWDAIEKLSSADENTRNKIGF